MTYLWLVLVLVVLLFGWTVLVGAPYVPSKKRIIRQALTKLYCLSKDDLLMDLGSGEGMVLREASRLGARAVGYEINPLLYLISKLLTKHDSKIKVRLSNYWSVQLPDDTTVVYMFGVGRDMGRLKSWLEDEAKRLNKKIYLISLGFEVKGMKPVGSLGPNYLYVF